MKVAKACKQCRTSKRKCSLMEGRGSCAPCAQRKLQCSLASQTGRESSRLHRPILPQKADSTASTSGDLDDISSEVCDDLVDLYLRLIHDKPHTLFHPRTIRERIQRGTAPKGIVYCIMALGGRFSRDSQIVARVPEFSSKARSLVKANIDDISLESIQATILLGNIIGADGDHDAASLFFGEAFRGVLVALEYSNFHVGVAIKTAQILHLPDRSADDDAIEMETKLRTWWTLYMIDNWASAGLGLPRQFPTSTPYPAPMWEKHFYDLHPGEVVNDRHLAKPDLWAHMLTLTRIFGQVQDLHRNHVAGKLTDFDVDAATQNLADELDLYARELPLEIQLNRETLAQHARIGLGQAFVALHLGYHHYATLLYFHYLNLDLEQTATVKKFASQCKHHAVAYSDLLRASTEQKGCEAVYFIVSHMTVVSSAVLLHTLLFGHESDLPLTRERLARNFQVLISLRKYWPAVAVMIDRLSTFQNMCMWSVDPNTHRVDNWTVKFLLEHALPIEDKNIEVTTLVIDNVRLTERRGFAQRALSTLFSNHTT
ncbi:hypothetical protein BDY21DRAFT_338784 [Lineolata rhizophorae]|uniref:Zn(2)-C6 fungal-type domain-containing protein n=1 Tax=Lineolata rhizophorae TaxID=578093 RepID=A0A6A6P7A3_9PEZI|nr:hypothetical protein BDY21DRAFT_338784 [Lineolata rhizophorae]